MERWALVSGLKGDLELYEQIQRDLQATRGVNTLFVLGDVISPERNCDALLARLQNPKRGDLRPNCCLLYTSPSPRDRQKSRMPSSA